MTNTTTTAAPAIDWEYRQELEMKLEDKISETFADLFDELIPADVHEKMKNDLTGATDEGVQDMVFAAMRKGISRMSSELCSMANKARRM